MADFGFPKDSRLLTSSHFKAVFDSAQYKISCRHFLMLAIDNKVERGRLGMVIAKKHVSKAIHRNRLKRLIRNSFRNTARNLPGLDVVVLARKNASELDSLSLANKLNVLWGDLQAKAAGKLVTLNK
ncbi:ribonuclease P protein component [Gammaproteobacteria bacterium]|mgnify:CR=1 FL=1|nr:ribonuclease P protein component [Gammaproteobacteria bacterium]